MTNTMTPVEKLNRIAADMRSRVVGHEDVIAGMCEALVANEHVYIIGPPGTGKSMVARMLGEYIDGNTFFWQLNRFSTPDEFYGPRSLRAMKNDEYLRNTEGRAADSVIVVADEYDKANTAIGNTGLGMMNEREFEGQPVPLRVLVATANAYLAGTTGAAASGDSLEALWDRFALRYEVDGHPSDSMLMDIIFHDDPGKDDSIPLLTGDDFLWFDRKVKAMKYDPSLRGTLIELRGSLTEKSIGLTPRRWKMVVRKLAAARAILRGRDTIMPSDLMVMHASAWKTPKQQAALEEILRDKFSPGLRRAMELLDEMRDVCQVADNATDVNIMAAQVEFAQKANAVLVEVKNLSGGDPGDEVKEQLREVREAYKRSHARLNQRLAEFHGGEIDAALSVFDASPSTTSRKAGFLRS